MGEKARKTGINIIGDAPWGTHFCQFYQTKEDLVDILVPYFRAGLENNEFCLWVTSEPLDAEYAKKALKKEVKNLDDYIKKGQIEILDYRQWYTRSGHFDSDKVLQRWGEKEKQSLKKGFDGIRITGNTLWLKRKDWKDFTDYEAFVNSVICKHRILAICTYSLDKCTASEIIDVVSNHQSTLIKREGKWEIIESAEHRRTQEEKEKLLKAVEITQEATVITAADGKIIYTNDSINKLFGYKEGELIGKYVSTLSAGPTPGKVMKQIMRVVEKQDFWEGELHNKRKDGTEFMTYATISAVKDKDGKVSNFISAQHDITKRKRTEETLRESEQRFRSLVETTSDWVWEVNQKGMYTYASPKVKDLLGYGPEEVIGKTPFDLMPPVEAERVAGLFRDIAKSRRPFAGLENTNLHKNGKRIILETSGVPILDADGNLLGYRGIDRDITERKLAEQQIENLAKFPSENPSPVLRIAKDGTVLYANFAGSELLEVWNCKAGAHAPEHWHRCILRVLKSGLSEDLEVVCKDRIFSMRMTPVVDCGYVNVYGIDITERKRTEEDLRKYRQHLEEMVEARTAELTESNKKLRQHIEQRKRLEKEILDISEREQRRIGQELHDSIGQQLTGVAFMTKALEQQLANKLPDEAAEAGEIAKLVNHAMSQTRGLAKGLQSVDLDAGSLMSALQELAATTEKLFGIRCIFKYDKPVSMDDNSVAVHLYRITQEAVTNAVKHGGAKNVEIALAHGRDESVLTIKSDGLNFPKESIARGTGMGLQIMEHRVDIIGGSLDIREAAEGGTIVTCMFPNKKQ